MASTKYSAAAENYAARIVASEPAYTLATLYQPIYYTGVGRAPAPAPAAPQPTAPASPTASASDLQILIASIPTAHDGQVITADYHNALRLALVAIANRMGLGPVSDEITVTVAPMLRPAASGGSWANDYGMAIQGTATTDGAIKGWIEADLPDGARIKKVIAYATGVVGSGGKLTIQLLRQKITDASVVPVLAEVVIPTGADLAKGVEADVTLPRTGAGVTAIEEFRVVDNRQHKYLVTAEIDDVTKVHTAKITAIQIILGR